MDQINNHRLKIDEIDNKIMALLEERYDLSEQIGALKSASNYDVLDTNRESDILSKISNYSHSPQIKAVYNCLFTQSKLLQRK